MTEPASVALHAVRRVNIEVGDEVTILGAGPVGIILAQWASFSGAEKIFIIDIMEEKLNIAKKLGFKYSFNATSEDPVEKIKCETDNNGTDVCFEAAGTPVTFEQSLRIVRKLGKVVLLGNIEGEVKIPEKTASMILRGQLEIHGSWNSSFAPLPKNEWKTTLQYMNLRKLSVEPLISHKLNLSQAKEAFGMMSKRKEFFNKVMFIF